MAPLLKPVVPPPVLLNREQACAKLTAMGYPIKPATLRAFVTKGGGPSYKKFGRKVLYDQDVLIEWARRRTVTIQAKPKPLTL